MWILNNKLWRKGKGMTVLAYPDAFVIDGCKIVYKMGHIIYTFTLMKVHNLLIPWQVFQVSLTQLSSA